MDPLHLNRDFSLIHTPFRQEVTQDFSPPLASFLVLHGIPGNTEKNADLIDDVRASKHI
jgi:hypothetical protein